MKHLATVLFLFLCFIGSAQSSSFITHDSIRISFDDTGKGPAILLIHGFINSRKSWEKSALKKDLLEKGYRVIVPDLRGNGDSDKPHDKKYWNSKNEILDIVSLMDHLDITVYDVVAYSRGVTVASELATIDSRINKIVLGGMGDEFTNPNWEIPGIFSDAFAGNIPLDDMTKGAVEYAESINADLMCLSLQQKYQPSPGKELLNKIYIPVLIIVGDQDDAENKTISLSSVFPLAQSKIIKGDHNNTYKQKNFSEAVIRFLTS
jgi:pimeloyl-ACP methyl ester carboxylesterase